MTWPGPLAVPCTVDVEVTAQDDGTVHCAITQASDNDAAEVAVYASAIGALVTAEQSVCDLADVQSRLATTDGGETYRGAGEVLHRVVMVSNVWSDHALPQPWWDAAMKASSLIGDEVALQAMGVPEVCVHAPLPATGWVWAPGDGRIGHAVVDAVRPDAAQSLRRGVRADGPTDGCCRLCMRPVVDHPPRNVLSAAAVGTARCVATGRSHRRARRDVKLAVQRGDLGLHGVDGNVQFSRNLAQRLGQ